MPNILPYRDRKADLRDRRQRLLGSAIKVIAVLLLSIALNAATCYVFIKFLCIPDFGICEAVCLGVAALATLVFVVVVLIRPPRTWPSVMVFAMASALPVVLTAGWISASERASAHQSGQIWLRSLFGTIPSSLDDYYLLPTTATPEEVWHFHMSDDEVRGLMINGWRMQPVTRATLPDKADLLGDPKYLTLGSDEHLYWVQINPSDMGVVRTLIWSPGRHECLLRLQSYLGPPGDLRDQTSGRTFEPKTGE